MQEIENKDAYNEYQKKAITTKIYDDSVAIPYIVLGIVGEAGELFEKIQEDLENMGSPVELLEKEIGDVAWYLAGFCAETGYKLGNIGKFKDINLKGRVGIEDITTSLIIQSAAIAEISKKALRDDLDYIAEQHSLPAVKMQKALIATANLLEVLEATCFFYGVELMDIMQQNIDKLASRAKRGVIKGSGDER